MCLHYLVPIWCIDGPLLHPAHVARQWNLGHLPHMLSRVNHMHSQASLYSGALLVCPMISLERATTAGLNPYLL
jgi:hypothetical protein